MDHLEEGPHNPKRRKIDDADIETNISSSVDLEQLLDRSQTSFHDFKQALQQFKRFLTTIGEAPSDEIRTSKLDTLISYSQKHIPLLPDKAKFSQLIQPWFTALESNNESLLSLIPSVLALYLKVISYQLELREIGLSLGRSLLAKDQLRLFDRGLTATTTKQHLISPCLRLLTEIVNFDGGELAHVVHTERRTTFQRLEVFLERGTSSVGDEEAVDQRPTLRRIAQRYILSHLRFQRASVKAQILTDGRTLRACLQHLTTDKADIVCDILSSLDNDVARNASITRRVKSKAFVGPILSLLATLYTSHRPANEIAAEKNPRGSVDKLLRFVCTQHEAGVLLPETGWYPPDSHSDGDVLDLMRSESTATAQNIALLSDSKAKPQVNNLALSLFIQTLQPCDDQMQASLLLDIFRAAPELVADYFARKTNFIVEPKDTPSWLAQSAFLFSVVQLPVPKFCGWKEGIPNSPPPSRCVIESVLPRPLSRGHITRSLNLNHEVITLFAVRAITVAFEKLAEVLKTYLDAWKQAGSELSLAFSQRIPLPKDVHLALHQTPKSDEQLRAAIIHLLTQYHRMLPHLMLTEKFDVSSALVEVLKRPEGANSSRLIETTELENLLQIAHHSPEMKWWSKPGSLHCSLFTSSLKVAVHAKSMDKPSGLLEILNRIAVEEGIVPMGEDHFSAIQNSFATRDGWAPRDETFSFFDNCASRISHQAVYYQGLAQAIVSPGAQIPLLLACTSEQWPFVVKRENEDVQRNAAQWVCRVAARFVAAGADELGSQVLHERLLNEITHHELKREVKRYYLEELSTAEKEAASSKKGQISSSELRPSVNEEAGTSVELQDIFSAELALSDHPQDLEALHQVDVAEMVANGRYGKLCTQLSSLVEETRRKAFITLQATMKRIEVSDYAEKRPLYLMTGELMETTKAVGIAQPLPNILTTFAAESGKILHEPAHGMYRKINTFLQRRPSWDVSKFIRYWIGKILLQEPDEDTNPYREKTWLLNLLIRGLRSEIDFELYRKSHVFERLLSWYMSRICTDVHRRRILEMIYRALSLGGSLTMVTRMGLDSWLKMSECEGRNIKIIQALRAKLHESLDEQAVQKWRMPSIKA